MRTLRRAWLSASVGAALFGCFTETGNPEEEKFEITARFAVDYAATHASPKATAAMADPIPTAFTQLPLNLWDAEFETDKGDTVLLGGDSLAGGKGRWVDFTNGDTLLWFPDSLLFRREFRSFHFNFTILKAQAINPDSIDYAALPRTSFLKGSLKRDSGNIAFLLELPKVNKLSLYYGATSLANFRDGAKGCHIVVTFRARDLFHSVSLDSVPISHDKRSFPFLMLTQKGQPALWKKIASNFYQSFVADSVRVEDKIPP